jgi:hypothetical protein
VLAVAAGPLIYFDSVAANPKDVAAEFSRLEKSGNENARDWLQLARDARDTEQLELAGAALDKASSLVSVLLNDPLINSMEGRSDYDALVREMSVQAYPCAHQQGFRDFDFWIGEWDVHLANGTRAGSNIIQSIERGCALTEHWSSANGGTGMSINYLDKASGEWVQVWNAANGAQINIRGGLTDDGMLLEGYIHYVSNGTTAPFRGLWTLLIFTM